MTDRRNNPTSPHREPRREFAFSRIAGATAGDYAAVNTLAVVAVVTAMLGVLGLLWVWWLIVPGVSLAMGGLALYYISTSAGTQTGRRIALTAIAVSVAFGLTGGIVHLNAHRVQEANKQHVRTLAAAACRDVLADRFDAVYEQLAPQHRNAVPPAHWRYEWRKALAQGGSQPTRIELSDRVTAIAADHILATMNVYFAPLESGGPERVYPIRLIYARGQAAPSEGNNTGQAEPAWELAYLPSFVNALPPQYPQPLVWPSPGKVERVTSEGDRVLVIEHFAEDGKSDPPSVSPGRKLVAELADEHLAPPPPWYRAWLPHAGQ